MALLFTFICILLFTICAANLGNVTCCVDWAKCGGQNFNGCTGCCNANYYCNKSDDYYSECVPFPIEPLPPAPESEWCGKEGKTLNWAKLSDPQNVNALEIGQIWAAATEKLFLIGV